MLTSLTNFLTPFVRYDILDDVTLGTGPCPCGRGLPLWTHVEGRRHPMLYLPDGERRSVIGIVLGLRQVGGCRQFQIIQRSPDHVVLRVVPDRLWSVGHAERMRQCVRDEMEAEVRVDVDEHEVLERPAGGKLKIAVVEMEGRFVPRVRRLRGVRDMISPHQERPVASAGGLSAAPRSISKGATNPGALVRDQGHDHWTKISRRWKQLAPPLRPCAEDIAGYTEVIRLWTTSFGVPRALILGVTPELYYLSWPAGKELIAVDHTQGMIDTVWPGPKSSAICAGWTELPLPDRSRDVVLCDGGLNGLSYPDDLSRLVHELHRVVAPNGLCGIRLFVPLTSMNHRMRYSMICWTAKSRI